MSRNRACATFQKSPVCHYLVKVPSLLSNPRIHFCCDFCGNQFLAFHHIFTNYGCISSQYSFIFPSFQLDVNRIILHVFFWSSFVGIMFVRLICVAVCGNSHSFLLNDYCAIVYYTNMPQFECPCCCSLTFQVFPFAGYHQ